MSGSVTMPDTSIFGAILRGHTQVAKDLQELMARGELLVVPWATYNEIQKTPNPVTKAVQLTLIQELGMTVQDPTTMKQRSEVYDTFAKTSTVPNDPNSKAPAKNVIQAKDVTIIADVIIYQQNEGKSKLVRLWTVERMATQQPEVSRLYGITFSHLTRAEPMAAFVSAQEVFALFPSLKGKFKLTKDGTIVRTFWSGKGGTAIKVGAIVVGGLVLRGLLGYFSVKVYARYAQRSLDEQFDEIRPQIENDLRSQREVALTLVAAGEQAFAVTVIKIWTNSDFVTEQGTTMPRVEYFGLTISSKKKESHTSETKHYVGNSSDIDIYTTSTPVTFDNDFVEIYKDYQKARKWYLQRLTATTNDAERNNLQEEYRAMIDEMNRILKQ